MNKSYSILLSFILLGIILLTLFLLSDYKKVTILEEESSFRAFKVESSKVIFDYLITLENNSNEPKEVQLSADMKEEVNLGLIVNPKLWASNKESGTKSFIVPADTIAIYEVEFIGDFTGTYQKASRLLPEIEIIEIEKE